MFAVNDEENAAKQTNNACAFDTQAMENKKMLNTAVDLTGVHQIRWLQSPLNP